MAVEGDTVAPAAEDQSFLSLPHLSLLIYGISPRNRLVHANIDWRETDNAHVFRVDLPGVRKEDLNAQVEDDNVLRIPGQRVVEKEDENNKWHRVERSRGSFSRKLRLPENAILDGIKV